MPQIDISTQTYKRLEAIAKPFKDTTPGSIIDRLLDCYMAANLVDRDNAPDQENASALIFDPRRPPDLTHAKLARAQFGNKDLGRINWARLVRIVHEEAFKRVQDFTSLRQMSLANLVRGTKEDEGFKPLEEFGFSIQGVDTNNAWKIACGLARKLNISIEVTFEWREKEGSAHPGKMGVLRWVPQGS